MTKYLTVDQIIAINADQDGGVGVQNREGVEQNAHRPQSGFGGHETFPDLWTKAAAYLHGIASTQYFTDGNKRTAWFVAVTFLAMNRRQIPRVPDIESEALVYTAALDVWKVDHDPDGTIAKIAEWFRLKYETKHPGPALDPRVEYMLMGTYAEDVDDTGNFNLMDGGLYSFGVKDGFPAHLQLGFVTRIHWTKRDLDAGSHDVTVRIGPDENILVRAVANETLNMNVPYLHPSGHEQHASGVMPVIARLSMRPLVLRPGSFSAHLLIDGVVAARYRFIVRDEPDPIWDDLL